ncbi:hypothetical protein GCM10010507_40930 [Streptomyces cinnamoneus]|uniref:Uncharacterized protein n=1 Tax=Streptomyces cinnamoneus TaxID=53446 RepID=A0A918WMJ0_STRCJ|nr:hypothetical protein GCM10010507_40930 [Streptomyces cinnamoneus]
MEEGQHDGCRVRIAERRDEIGPVHAFKGAFERRGIVPVEPYGPASVHGGGASAGGLDAPAPGGEPGGDAAAGGAGGPDDQGELLGGSVHQLLPAKWAARSWTASGFQ